MVQFTIFFISLLVFFGSLCAQTDNLSAPHTSAYYYPWYDKDGRHWNEGFDGKLENNLPALGVYSSRDPNVIYNHRRWSQQMGINNWICAWWGQESWEDVTIKHRVAPVLEQLDQKHGGEPVTFCLLYESQGLLGLDPGKGIDITLAKVPDFVNHFDYLSKTYFNHPAYYKIDGKPVVYLYVSRAFVGEYKLALSLARAKCKSNGHEVYLVGDDVYWGEPDRERIKCYDAITAYNMHGPILDSVKANDWPAFIDDCESVYKQYKIACAELGVAFIPNIMPGFNSHGADPNQKHYIIPRKLQPDQDETSMLSAFAKMAARHLDSSNRSVAITSFNEWHEGTQLEPMNTKITITPERWGGILNEAWATGATGAD